MALSSRLPQAIISYQWPQARFHQDVASPRLTYDGPRLEIDQKAPMAEIGLKSQSQFARMNRDMAQREVLSGIGRRAREGDRLAAEMTRGDTFVRIAKETTRSPIPQLNVDVAPKSRPRIDFVYDLITDWTKGDLSVEWQQGSVQIEWELGEGNAGVTGIYIDLKG